MNKRSLAVAAEQTFLPNAAPMSLNDFAAVQDNVYLYTQGNVSNNCAGAGPMFQYGGGSGRLATGCSNYGNPNQFSARHYSVNLNSEQGNMHKHGPQYPKYLSAHLPSEEHMTRAQAQGKLVSLGYPSNNRVDVANSCIGQPMLGQAQPAYTFQVQQFYSPQTATGWHGCGGNNSLSPFGGVAPPLNP